MTSTTCLAERQAERQERIRRRLEGKGLLEPLVLQVIREVNLELPPPVDTGLEATALRANDHLSKERAARAARAVLEAVIGEEPLPHFGDDPWTELTDDFDRLADQVISLAELLTRPPSLVPPSCVDALARAAGAVGDFRLVVPAPSGLEVLEIGTVLTFYAALQSMLPSMMQQALRPDGLELSDSRPLADEVDRPEWIRDLRTKLKQAARQRMARTALDGIARVESLLAFHGSGAEEVKRLARSARLQLGALRLLGPMLALSSHWPQTPDLGLPGGAWRRPVEEPSLDTEFAVAALDAILHGDTESICAVPPIRGRMVGIGNSGAVGLRFVVNDPWISPRTAERAIGRSLRGLRDATKVERLSERDQRFIDLVRSVGVRVTKTAREAAPSSRMPYGFWPRVLAEWNASNPNDVLKVETLRVWHHRLLKRGRVTRAN